MPLCGTKFIWQGNARDGDIEAMHNFINETTSSWLRLSIRVHTSQVKNINS